MKKRLFIFIFCFAFLLASCSLPEKKNYEEISQSNLPPKAWIDAPLNESYLPFAPYEIVVHATDQQTILMTEISVDDIVLTTVENPQPSSNLATIKYMWNPETSGKHIIAARGQGQDGEWSNPSYTVVYLGEPTITNTPAVEPTATLTPTSTATTQPGFTNFNASPASVHFGDCTPNQVQVSVQAVDTAGITTVTLFYRMRDENGQTTDWSNAAMNDGGNNQFSKAINLASFSSPYANGTLDIQLVIQNKNGDLVRSEVYSQVGISSCLQPLYELDLPNIHIIPLNPTKTPIVVK